MVNSASMDSLYNFIGYGNLAAPLWCLGREEGVGRRPKGTGWNLEWEIQVRAGWETVMDARLAHVMLQDPYWEDPNGSQVWKYMAMLARGLLHGSTDWQDPGLTWTCVVDHLGRAHGETLIGEAFPLPKARIGSWLYTRLFPTQKEYKRAIWPQRQALWQRLLAEHSPRFVIAYGGWWQSRRETFGDLNWEPLNQGRVLTAIMVSGTRVYLTPFFKYGLLKIEDLQAVIQHNRG